MSTFSRVFKHYNLRTAKYSLIRFTYYMQLFIL